VPIHTEFAMMEIVDHLRRRLTNAWTVLCGAHGEITRQAERRGQSRQALYRDAAAVVTALDGSEARARFDQLEARIAEQAARIEQLEADRRRSVAITAEIQAAFAATAQAEGVSLPVARRLLAVLLGAATPSVATLGRFSRDAAHRSGRLLEVLDAEAAARVTRVTADEIFSARRRS
jgi:outer membrane murein-binding lipoprotein Lpp